MICPECGRPNSECARQPCYFVPPENVAQAATQEPWQPMSSAPADRIVLVYDDGYIGKAMLVESCKRGTGSTASYDGGDSIMKQHMLVGQTITAVALADDREAIKFALADGREIIARCDADCCSSTWIEDVIDPAAALGTVTKAEDIALPDEWQVATKTGKDEEEMAYYGFAIETEKGRCTIAYRNSSNGYYGGSLEWPDSGYFYGGVCGHNISKELWRPLVGIGAPVDAADPHV